MSLSMASFMLKALKFFEPSVLPSFDLSRSLALKLLVSCMPTAMMKAFSAGVAPGIPASAAFLLATMSPPP